MLKVSEQSKTKSVVTRPEGVASLPQVYISNILSGFHGNFPIHVILWSWVGKSSE